MQISRRARIILGLVPILLAASASRADEIVQAVRAGGTGYDYGRGIAVDGSRNSFVTGEFQGIADFGPFQLYSTDPYDRDAFVAKVDDNGQFKWVRRMGGTETDLGLAIATTANGDTYVTGVYCAAADFGPFLLAPAMDGACDAFVVKLDGSGVFQWAMRFAGASDTSYVEGDGIAVDASGNAYVSGQFCESTDFGPFHLTPAGGCDGFVAELNGSNGSVQWAKRMGSESNDDVGRAIAADPAGNVYVAGFFDGTADFGPFNLTTAGSDDAFVVKLNGGGVFQWARRMGGPSPDNGAGIAADASGNAYVTGKFCASADFGTFNLAPAGACDAFVAKLDGSGTFEWVRRAGGTDFDLGLGIAVDGRGSVYVSGEFNATAGFGPYSLTSAGAQDDFVAKLDGDGVFLWARRAGSSASDEAFGIAVDTVGSAHVTGMFAGTTGFGGTTLSAAGYFDVFVARLDATYVALGDSYSSGEGNPPYLSGINVSTNKCHRSRQAYPYRIKFHGLSVTDQNFIACSGAITDNVRPGGAPQYEKPAQLDQSYDFDPSVTVVNPATQLVTLTIGGNDVGFTSILSTCAFNCPVPDPVSGTMIYASCESNACRPFGPQGMSFRQSVMMSLAPAQAKVLNAHRCIRTQVTPPDQQDPAAAVVALGYPNLFTVGPGSSCPVSVSAFFGESERSFLNDIGALLDGSLNAAAAAAGVHYVSVRGTFAQHGVCSSDSWLNGWKWHFRGSFHPNSKGHAEYAKALDALLVRSPAPRLLSGYPENPSPVIPGSCNGAAAAERGMTSFLDPSVPSVSSMSIEPLASGVCESHGLYVPGEDVRVRGTGFGPGAEVTPWMAAGAGSFGARLATLQADPNGDLDAVVQIPPGAPTSGDALIQATGARADGGVLLLSATIGLSTSFGSDHDADGAPDPCDNCPMSANADQADGDGDEIGDVCDVCPNDPENDLDGDGLCADIDSCPLDRENDADGDGSCETFDNCPMASNPDQTDADGDGAGDACDVAPNDPGVIAAPDEVGDLFVGNDKVTWTWISAALQAGSGTVHDVVRGEVRYLPVGSGPSDTCVASGIGEASVTDPTLPQVGSGFWYLVRGRNLFAAGSYGAASTGAPRTTTACP